MAICFETFLVNGENDQLARRSHRRGRHGGYPGFVQLET
jgi:hypothetical protein